MSATNADRHRLYRSNDSRVFLGVCGGLAEYFGFNVVALRILAFIVIFSMSFIGLIGYILMGFMMPLAPDRPFDNIEDEDFFYSAKASPKLALLRVQRRFEQLDKRLQRMESIVVSPAFELEQEYRKL
jgi:phage shock protein C